MKISAVTLALWSLIDKRERDSAMQACKTAARNAVDRAPATACPRLEVLTACEAAQRMGRACSPSSDVILVFEH